MLYLEKEYKTKQNNKRIFYLSQNVTSLVSLQKTHKIRILSDAVLKGNGESINPMMAHFNIKVFQ